MNIIISILSYILVSFFLISNDEIEKVDTDRDYIIQSDTLLYPNSKHREQSKLIYQLLTKYHYKKMNVNSLQDRFFREYYRSGNVFIYRFDASLTDEDALKVTQVYGAKKSTKNVTLPARYIILNPADVQLGGSISFHAGTYYKVLSDYELERLKNPRTEEDVQVLNGLDPKVKKLIKQKRAAR